MTRAFRLARPCSRPALWGLNIAGKDGVVRVLDILNEELVTVMQLCGTTTIDSITPAAVRDREAKN